MQNPFQIVGGGPAADCEPSPFEAVSTQRPVGLGEQSPAGQVPDPRQVTPAPPEANPFQIAGPGDEAPPAGTAPAQVPEGGFEMKGFRPGPAPMNQLGTAPLGGQTAEAAPPVDPFAGMDLAQPAAPPAPPVPEPAAKESAPAPKAPAAPEPEPAPEPEEEDFAGRAPEPTAKAVVKAEPKAEPEVPAEPRPPKKAPAKAKATPRAAAKRSAPPRKPVSDMHQLELRAIFGVDHDLSHQEIVRRARALPGIRNVATIEASDLGALDMLRDSIARWGFGDSDSISISCPDGIVDFISSGEISLAILYDGDYAPGVRETLIIVARELDKL